MLTAIRNQDYPCSKIEHIVMDAGSPKETLDFIKQYNTRVVVRKDLLEKAQVRISLGIQLARGELILILEPDNILPSKNWLQQMVQPFVQNRNVVCAFSKYNTYEASMPAFTKYCALFGINDPLLYYLDKSDKLPRFESEYHKGIERKRTHGYTILSYTKDTLPTLGDNGHMFRRDLIMKVNLNPDTFLHTDAFAMLVEKGYTEFAAVNNSIIHYTGSSIVSFLKRRVEYKGRYYDPLKSKRHYLVYDPHSATDRKNLLLFIIYSLTFIEPLSLSIRGYIAVHEGAWFLHPIACFMTLMAYGYSEVRYGYHRVMKRYISY